MGQQLGIKCCQEIFTNDSIESDDEDTSAQLLDFNMSTNKVKQNTNNLKNRDGDNVLPSMNEKTMELLLTIDAEFAPKGSKQNAEDYRIQETETNKRLKVLQQLSNPEDLETAIFAHYATDSDLELTDMDTMEIAQLDNYGFSVSSLDEAEREEIDILKSGHNSNSNTKRKSNVYRQSTTTPWSSEDIFSLHDDMKQEYMNLSRDSHTVSTSYNTNTNIVSPSISNEKEQMKKQMMHLVQQSKDLQ